MSGNQVETRIQIEKPDGNQKLGFQALPAGHVFGSARALNVRGKLITAMDLDYDWVLADLEKLTVILQGRDNARTYSYTIRAR